MSNPNQENRRNMSGFYERYTTFTDPQILEILKNQKNYQESARNAAIQIAVERRLIHSEQDLLAPEFQSSKDTKLSLFPTAPNAYHNNRLVGSVFRFLLIFSLLPVVYGVLKYSEGQIDQAILGVGIGAIWFLGVTLFKTSKKMVIFILLLGLLILSGVLTGLKLIGQDTLKVLDIVMFVISLLLPAYFLFYAKKLTANKPKVD